MARTKQTARPVTKPDEKKNSVVKESKKTNRPLVDKKKGKTTQTKGKTNKRKPLLRDNIQGITSSAIKRLAKQAGVSRVSSLVYEEARELLKDELTNVLRKSITLTEHLRKRTVDSKSVCASIPSHMYTSKSVYKIFKSYKKDPNTKKRRSGVVLREIKHFQKQYGTFLIRKVPFSRLVREISQDFRTDLRFTKGSLSFLQTYIETFMVDFLRNCAKIMQHYGKLALSIREFKATRELKTNYYEFSTMYAGPAVNFETYISKVLKQVHPNHQISGDCRSQINGFTNYLGTIIAGTCSFLSSKGFNGKKTKKTISSRTVQTTVRLLFPKELSKHAVSEGTKAVTRFTGPNSGKEKERVSRTSRAGLQFSVSVCEHFLRDFGKSVGSTAAVYLAAVLEYITAEIIEQSGNAARDNKKTQISARSMFLAVDNDEELKELFKKLNYKIMGGGVSVFLPIVSDKKTSSKKKSVVKDDDKSDQGSVSSEDEDEGVESSDEA